jgi:hypothetical protein
MNARTLIAVVCTTVLTACAGGSLVINERYFPSGIVLVPLDRKVKVTVEDGVIVVSREPLKVNAHENSNGTFDQVTVTFKLDTAGYTFAPTQMSPDPLKWGTLLPPKASPLFGSTTCTFGGNEQTDMTELNCTFTPSQKEQLNTYVLRVYDGKTYIASDPSMVN